MTRKRKIRSRPSYERVIVENCITAFIDGGNSIKAMWDNYLTPLVERGDITQPYAKQKAREALDTIVPAYKDMLKLINKGE